MDSKDFRVLIVDLTTGKSRIESIGSRVDVVGGSGLAALLFSRFGLVTAPWDDPRQPLVFAIGPLTGYFPLMSKTVCSFKSNYHGEYTESHAGGRCALALRFCNLDALVIVGQAARLSCLAIASNHIGIVDAEILRGEDADRTGKLMRRMFKEGSGHRSILRIGPAGENCSALACINVDTYRHFGRMGGGAAMGVKKLKGIIIHGNAAVPLPESRTYNSLYKEVYSKVTSTDMMRKYHDLGTPANLETLNEISSLPWRNLQATADPEIAKLSGQTFADLALLRNGACGGCPVGCIHIGFFRDKVGRDNRYHYHQVAYDYEPIFAAGTMLGIKDAFDVLRILDALEKTGLDAMSGGVALGWATEATERGLISEKETIVRLRFGNADNYRTAAKYLGEATNDFYNLLAQGTLTAAGQYGGEEFGCVLGQEMAGYATGELFFAAQTLGFRHSHLDTGAYSYDQKHVDKDVAKAVDFLIDDEPGRVYLTSMVACLFARSVYETDTLGKCLDSAGYGALAVSMETAAEKIRAQRWKLRFATGFHPDNLIIPKRFYQVNTWKGKVDPLYLDQLKEAYGQRLLALVQD